MSQKEYEHQRSLIDTHLAKAEQCLEYYRVDDAKVHLMIAKTLRQGLNAQWDYDKEALLNTTQALV